MTCFELLLEGQRLNGFDNISELAFDRFEKQPQIIEMRGGGRVGLVKRNGAKRREAAPNFPAFPFCPFGVYDSPDGGRWNCFGQFSEARNAWQKPEK